MTLRHDGAIIIAERYYAIADAAMLISVYHGG